MFSVKTAPASANFSLHGTDLYFYDDTKTDTSNLLKPKPFTHLIKRGVFSFKQIINGDKTLGDNIALDIQEELMQIAKMRTAFMPDSEV